jgi:hypothetical protein
MTLLIPGKRERVASPLPERERIKVRVLVERAIFFAPDLGFCLREFKKIRILNRAPKEVRWIKTLTFDPLPFWERGRLSGRGDAAAI